ncbi:double-strand break repair protein AddB [Rhizobiales bacterium RZME27]|uniref:Double-strand break repair protein AddB n=1 Tax=Endobacterium cereale TaxID=2663029 RepID=A0A6A8A587_9HYPH|nr:double-strand break repair protein AddB [Endobacterium cereale]MEB2845258.1 double-strand break repair protein AddB [Endobacterium cereale]MQY46039.1 double-strand break repair protein AddB [Endobacterium cereale]
MSGTRHKRFFTVPPAVPFLHTIASKLLDGSLVEGFRHDPEDPLSLSKVTIFVPTRRAARVLRSEFVDLLGGRSAILPIIRPLGETDDDSGYFDLTAPEEMDLALPIGGVARLLELARLILAWRNQLPLAITAVHSTSPLVAPASPADAIWLARALAELVDSIETEERDWNDLEKLDTTEHPLWWQLTAEFLKIASAFWPARLEELRRSSPARHQSAILRGEARRIVTRQHQGPVIVAGSTGSVPAAADLIASIASLPNGVIVLPGLDRSMSDEDWLLLDDDAFIDQRSEPAARSHPQFGLSKLLKRLQIDRSEVETLDLPASDLLVRAATISKALAPAKATDDWSEWRTNTDKNELGTAFSEVSLIEAANEREEATTIAIALRLALEQPGRHGQSQAALITPDRALARRVMAELARFDIIADDTAGAPLSSTLQGTLLTLMLEAILRPGDPVPIIGVIKHPLACFGMPKGDAQEAAHALELLALRGGIGEIEIDKLSDLLERRLEEQKADRHTPQWRLSLPDTAAIQAKELADRIATAVEPLASCLLGRLASGRGSTIKLPLGEWAARSGRVLEGIATDERGDLSALWSGEAGERLANMLSEVIETDGQMQADGPQWIDIVAALTAAEAVKPKALNHPRIFIFGTLEARLQSVDMLVLGGLNEGSWPGQSVNNPFLSRSMKVDLGLEPPERRIGQLAHDFEMASGTRKLIYSRSMRQGTAPTVASRWLQRLLALGGQDFARTLRARGDVYRTWAALIDDAPSRQVSPRPSPIPPADMQPTKYSFSEVGRLRRDPYSIYAARVLRLDPLKPFNEEPGAAQRGTLYHRIIDQYTRESHLPGTPAAREAILRLTNTLFDAEMLPSHVDQIWRPRFIKVAEAFLIWEKDRAADIKETFTELAAGFDIPEAGIRLTGIADRIDIKASGRADIIDYKTGLSPSVNQARSLLDPQLALEAAALLAGGFKNMPALTPEELTYVRLRPGERFATDTINNEFAKETARTQPKSAIDLANESRGQLAGFVNLLRSGKAGFSSRLVPMMQSAYDGDYDHLARVAEWSTAEFEEGESDE